MLHFIIHFIILYIGITWCTYPDNAMPTPITSGPTLEVHSMRVEFKCSYWQPELKYSNRTSSTKLMRDSKLGFSRRSVPWSYVCRTFQVLQFCQDKTIGQLYKTQCGCPIWGMGQITSPEDF